MEKRYYVYEWYIKETNEVFYVGKGTGRRAKQLKDNKYFMKMYNTHDCDVRIVHNNLCESEAFAKEIELIKHYRSNEDKFGYNMTNGGNFRCIGWSHDEVAKIKISEAAKGRKGNNQENMTEEQRDKMKQKMSEKRRGKNNWAYGKAFDVEYRKKLSDSHKGKKPSTKTILKRIEKIKGRTKISHEQILDLYDKRKSGWSMKDLETNSNVSRTTLYTYFKKIDSKQLIINI